MKLAKPSSRWQWRMRSRTVSGLPTMTMPSSIIFSMVWFPAIERLCCRTRL